MKRSAYLFAAISALSVFSILAVPALAQERGPGRGRPGHDHPCRAEVEQLCPDAQSHEARRACVLEHRAQLSASCQADLDKREERRALLLAACQEDAAQICPGVEPGRDLMQCMGENRDALSDTCKAAIEEAHPHRGRGKRGHHKGKKGGGESCPHGQGSPDDAP